MCMTTTSHALCRYSAPCTLAPSLQYGIQSNIVHLGPLYHLHVFHTLQVMPGPTSGVLSPPWPPPPRHLCPPTPSRHPLLFVSCRIDVPNKQWTIPVSLPPGTTGSSFKDMGRLQQHGGLSRQAVGTEYGVESASCEGARAQDPGPRTQAGPRCGSTLWRISRDQLTTTEETKCL